MKKFVTTSVKNFQSFRSLKKELGDLSKKILTKIDKNKKNGIFSMNVLALLKKKIDDIGDGDIVHGDDDAFTYNEWYIELVEKYKKIITEINDVDSLIRANTRKNFEMSDEKLTKLESLLSRLKFLEDEYSKLYDEYIFFKNSAIPEARVTNEENINVYNLIPQKNLTKEDNEHIQYFKPYNFDEEAEFLLTPIDVKPEVLGPIENMSKYSIEDLKNLFPNNARLHQELDEIENSASERTVEERILETLRKHQIGGFRKKTLIKKKTQRKHKKKTQRKHKKKTQRKHKKETSKRLFI